MPASPRLSSGLAVVALLAAAAAAASAAEPPKEAGPTSVETLIVTADRAGLLERRANDTVFGLDKPLIETPRSASLISDLTIQRYGILTVDRLITVAPGAFTASFYGVPGALNVRGTYAETYFDGFKLAENLGTYATPVGAAARIEVVRGPPSPVYGPGKVGGLLNFVPKSPWRGGGYVTRPEGEITATYGAEEKRNLTLQGAAPLRLLGAPGGVSAYAEIDDSHSYYRGIYPKYQLGQLTARFDVRPHWTATLETQLFHSTGEVQTPGWNRLTQDLIDHGTYVTGRNTALVPAPGAAYLTPNQTVVPARPPGIPFYSYPALYTATGAGLFSAWFGQPLAPTAASALTTGVGGTSLSRRTVYVSPLDHSETWTPTVKLAIERDDLPGAGSVRWELFYNGLENRRFVGYGFPAWLRTNVLETRLTYTARASALGGLIVLRNLAGVSDRYTQARDMQSFNSGVIALDRRDISRGASPGDSLCDPFAAGITGDTVPGNCLGWENDIHSRINIAGLFDTADIDIGPRLNLVLGGRVDHYDVKSSDSGILPYEATGPVSASRTLETYTVSAAYRLGWGLRPYATYAVNSALAYGQASDLATSLIQSGGWVRTSQLAEAGVKGEWLGGRLIAALDVYRQTRPQLFSAGSGFTVVDTVGKGAELEVRYVASRRLSLTFAGNLQHTEVFGPDTSFQYLPAASVCGANLACYQASFGAAYAVYSYASVPGRGGNYALAQIPHSVDSLYASYSSDAHAWGKAGITLGGTYVSKTSGTVPGAVTYPAYMIANASLFLQRGRTEIDLNIDNLFDRLYFTPDADTYVNIGALPGVGRQWRVTLKRRF